MKKMSKHRILKRISAAILALIIIVLIVLRLYLSSWVLDYVNSILSHIQGYKGSVESINIDLYRGAYRINKLVLNKDDGKIPTPFLAIDVTDLSVQWRALLHGRIVSSVELIHPVINFASTSSSKQTGANVDWTKPIKALTPVDINHVTMTNGEITYQDFSSSPQVNLYVKNMSGRIENLRNVERPGDALPSTIEIEGSSIGHGKLKIDGKANILKEVPDMNMLLSLEDVDLPAINNYTDAYAAFDFKSGNFNLYSQMKVKDGNVSGYVKPMVTHLEVQVLENDNPVKVVWSSAVAAILKVFSNLSKDQFATKVELNGTLTNINTDIWSALVGILQNAFVSAMKNGFDQTSSAPALDAEKPAQ